MHTYKLSVNFSIFLKNKRILLPLFLSIEIINVKMLNFNLLKPKTHFMHHQI
jgi:hypothetical protein